MKSSLFGCGEGNNGNSERESNIQGKRRSVKGKGRRTTYARITYWTKLVGDKFKFIWLWGRKLRELQLGEVMYRANKIR